MIAGDSIGGRVAADDVLAGTPAADVECCSSSNAFGDTRTSAAGANSDAGIGVIERSAGARSGHHEGHETRDPISA
jgi:hypothetical protein